MAGHHSVFVVAAWHTAHNLTTATEATAGAPAAASSTVVMVVAIWVLVRDGRRSTRTAGLSDSEDSPPAAARP